MPIAWIVATAGAQSTKFGRAALVLGRAALVRPSAYTRIVRKEGIQ
jgi:hypothetical protein